MNVVAEEAGSNGTSVKALANTPVVFFNDNIAAGNVDNPGDVPSAAAVVLGNGVDSGLAVDADASGPGSLVPGVGVAPVGTLVLVGEVNAKHLVDAEGNEGGALALVEVPRVYTTTAAGVWVVVLAGNELVASFVVNGVGLGNGSQRGQGDSNV